MTLRGYYRLAAETARARDVAVAKSDAVHNAYDRWARLDGEMAYNRFKGALRRRADCVIGRMYEAQVARSEARFRMAFDPDVVIAARREREAHRQAEEMRKRTAS